jgi:peptidoglycan/xylan/chitin deacetylase (PgdA/CDA1 family)
MEGHPQLFAEHDRSHNQGADVVLGHIPLHPDSPPGFMGDGVKSWANNRAKRLSAADAILTLHDLLTGQISLSRELFHNIGGFDTKFTFGGSFGNEDIDFGYRLLNRGYKIVFNPNAISWQYYMIQPRQYLRQWHQAGQADVQFARKYPDQAETIFTLNGSKRFMNRYFWRPLQYITPVNALLSKPLRWLTLGLVDRQIRNAVTIRLFRETVASEYWRGVHETGGIPKPRTLRVLAYHAIADFSKNSIIEPYGVPPAIFRCQLDILQRAGFHFVNAEELLQFLYNKSGLPRHPLLLTFDDGYKDLIDIVLPIIKEYSIPIVVFPVSGRLGGTNDWDEAAGVPQISLLDADDLLKLVEQGVEIGSHSHSHRDLTRIEIDELSDEIQGSLANLEGHGLDRPRLFAYPYGESNPSVRRFVREVGFKAAFTVSPGFIRANKDPFRLPRIEVLKDDRGLKFLWKVFTAGRILVGLDHFRSTLRIPHRLLKKTCSFLTCLVPSIKLASSRHSQKSELRISKDIK